MDSRIWVNGHLKEEILEEYAFGRLKENETSAVEEHYLACTTCQDALETVEEEIRTVRSVFATAALHPPLEDISFWDRAAWWMQSFWEGHQAAVAGAALALACVTGVVAYGWMNGRAPLVPSAVMLASYRGAENFQQVQAPAGRPLELHINGTDIPSPELCRVELVNATGQFEWSGKLTGAENLLASVPKALAAGQYWVRVYAPDNTLLREFGLRLN